MKTPKILIIVLFALWAASICLAGSDDSSGKTESRETIGDGNCEADRLVVGLFPGSSIDVINALYGTVTVEHQPGTRDYLLGTVHGADLEALAELMSADPAIEFAEENHTSETAEGIQKTTASFDRNATTTTFRTQPALSAVQGPEAHLVPQGFGVLVAIVDNGVDFQHPELSGHLAANGFDFVDGDDDPSETANGIDDDLDGSVDEGRGHGTHVAGLVLLAAPDATILSVRVLDDEGRGAAYRVARGIRYAVSQGARVINLSLSVRRSSSLIAEAVREALDSGVTVVAAAGNGGVSSVDTPANVSDVIATAATSNAGVKLPYSNYGSGVDICAPGDDVLSAFRGGGFARWGGTSMAAPFVSGGAAILLARYPMLEPKDVLTAMRATATSIRAQNPNFIGQLGAGLINLGGLATIPAESAESLRMQPDPVGAADWEPVTGAFSYDLIRGDVANMRQDAGTIDLGAVTCIADDSISTDTSLLPDSTLPAPGSAFFYVMRYDNVQGVSGYGQSSLALQRLAAAGDCPR